MNIVHAIITCLISFATAFAATWILGFDDPAEPGEQAPAQKGPSDRPQPSANASKAPIQILSPLSGKTVPLSEVNDAVFSQKVLGDGIAVLPEEGKVYAPIDGRVTALFETKHAVGLESSEGAEILIHIGIDTVNLEGKYFTAHVKNGDTIKKGDLLITFDKSAIEQEGYETITPVLVTNTASYDRIEAFPDQDVRSGDLILNIR